MRALIQRVSSAAVEVEGGAPRLIGPGLVVLLGVSADDGERDADWLAEKILSLRLFAGDAIAVPPAAEGSPSDEPGRPLAAAASKKSQTGRSEFDRSVAETGGEVLVVSQFTLYADVRKGRRPDFTKAAPPEKARALYARFVEALRARHPKIATGEFGATMKVTLANEGPVTIPLDSSEAVPRAAS